MYIPILIGDVVKLGDGSQAVVVDIYVPDNPAETQGHNMLVVERNDGSRTKVFEEELTLVQLVGGEGDKRYAQFREWQKRESETRINRWVRLRRQRELVGDGVEPIPGFSGSPATLESMEAYSNFLKKNEEQLEALTKQMTPEEQEEARGRFMSWFRSYLSE